MNSKAVDVKLNAGRVLNCEKCLAIIFDHTGMD